MDMRLPPEYQTNYTHNEMKPPYLWVYVRSYFCHARMKYDATPTQRITSSEAY